MKFSRYIIGTLMLAGMLSLVSCTDELREGTDSGQPSDADNEMVDILLTFRLEDDGDDATRGSNPLENIDLLVYALRDVNDNVLYQYGRGIIHEDYFKEACNYIDGAYTTGALKNYKITEDNNQTLMHVEWKNKGVTADNVHIYEMQDAIVLRVMRNKVFKLSVWAQNSKTEAYDFNYLTAVRVNYDDLNNLENRDAFCATSIFSIGQVDSSVEVTLTRPFAQVNVGVLNSATDGTDFKGFTHSAIELEGVSMYFNVVENKSWSSSEVYNFVNNKEKYYANYNKHIFEDLKTETEEEKYETILKKDKEGNYIVTTTAKFLANTMPSETLKIHNFSTSSTSGNNNIAEYKWLSMSYVLVPELIYPTDSDGNYIEGGQASGNINDQVYRWYSDIYGNVLKFKKDNQNNWIFEAAYDSSGQIVSEYQYYDNNKIDNWVRDKVGNFLLLNENSTDVLRIITTDDDENTIYLTKDEGSWEILLVIKPDGTEMKDELPKFKEEFLSTFTYNFDADNIVDSGVIYPIVPEDAVVTVSLLSLSLYNNSSGSNGSIFKPTETYTNENGEKDVRPLRIKVKRNWRSNLLYNTWTTLSNQEE